MVQENKKMLHFIGVGGVGMSGIAHVAVDQGYQVSGSDIRESKYTQLLRSYGVQVTIGHDANNVPEGNPIVVVSTAIMAQNPECVAAHERGLTIWHRAKMLAELGNGLKTLAVAGTHGKTTTSSMVATALTNMDADPTFLIGGIVRSCDSNARSGKGCYYVVEADESDKSFTYLSPWGIIVTNVEADHLDHYADLSEIRAKFSEFMHMAPAEGYVVAYADDPQVLALTQGCAAHVVTYGSCAEADFRLLSWKPVGLGSEFEVRLPDGDTFVARLSQTPGIHNALNALACMALLSSCGYEARQVAAAIEDFGGVKRRFEKVAEVGGVTIVDDYAHHPTEIAATIAAAKKLPFKHVHVLFQPHRYSRIKLFTEVLRDQFASAFDLADSVTFMDVYSAGETPIPGITGKSFLQPVLEHAGHPEKCAFIPRRIDTVDYVVSLLEPGDLVITMGAGDVTAMGSLLADALANKAQA